MLSGRLKGQAENQMASFFEQEVAGGYVQLQKFGAQLELAMELEAKVSINVKGFSSPLTSEDYNQQLSKRRISSVLNYLTAYNNGVLKTYIENGSIKIYELSLGETKVDLEVSDNPNNLRKSVYSISASRERRIDIQSILMEWQ